MNSLNDREPLGAELLDLTGVRILLVEDSWPVGVALKSLLPHSYLVSPRLFMMPRQRRKHRARSQAVVTASFASCGQLVVRIYFSLAVLVSWGSQGGLLFEGVTS
jgi:hypothetical protein